MNTWHINKNGSSFSVRKEGGDTITGAPNGDLIVLTYIYEQGGSDVLGEYHPDDAMGQALAELEVI